jgi:type IV pilus assembly protein PilY1
MKHITRIKRTTLAIGIVLLLAAVTTPQASAANDLTLADVPLFVELGIDPNIMLTYDDSGSMGWAYAPDSICSRWNTKRGFSNTFNMMYYDPNTRYTPGVNPDGNSLGDSDFFAAWNDGYTKTGGIRNLDIDYGARWTDLSTHNSCSGSPPFFVNDPSGGGFGRAYYYQYDGTGPITNDANYNLVRITGAAQQQNFANWYSYYRNRSLVARNAAGRAFASDSIPDYRVRLAYQRLNTCRDFGGNPNATCPGQVVKPLVDDAGASLTTRSDFFKWLYASPASGGTPLRQAMKYAGAYLSDSNANSPWAESPTISVGTEFSCRQNFHVAFTDGLWNGNKGVAAEYDNNSYTFPDGQGYSPNGTNQKIYSFGQKENLADNAFYYWSRDARTDLTDDVPPYIVDNTGTPDEVYFNPVNDPATWQHMVQYNVGLGLNGRLNYPGDYNALLAGTKNWSSSGTSNHQVDDMWHAAINGRGQYFSAQNPAELTTAFSAIIQDVLARTGSGSAVALNSGSLEAGSRIYQGRFTSGTWTGQVLAFDLSTTTGAVLTPEAWDAAPLLDARVAGSGWDSNREVVTFDGGSGVPFRWGSLSSGMQTDLNQNGQGVPDVVPEGDKRLEYLRGSKADEGTSGNGYRGRVSALGDIVNGAPVYVGVPPFNYPDNLESGQAYSAFKAAHNGRTPMIYVGANDGILHGFDANLTSGGGEEVIAYVPQKVFPNLTKLTSTNYPHYYYVDGPPTMGDAFWGATWHTVLVGGLNKGGQGIYALDITDPASFSESNAGNLALWEFTDADDNDLGYTYSRPAIVRLQGTNGWAAVFGNGYNSTEVDGSASSNGNAALYIVNIETGALILKIDTGEGAAQDPTGGNRPNGLATVSAIDVDGDRMIDYIYGGDLFGNLWKFDVSGSTVGSWGVAYGGSPLFVAKDVSGVEQAITTNPEVSLHPDNNTAGAFSDGGYMLYFGTGKYIEPSDNVVAGTQTQTFYGIWDPNESTLPPNFVRSNLLQQTIDKEIVALGAGVRITSDNTISWRPNPLTTTAGDHLGWYMDLLNTEAGNTDPKGERQVTTSVLRSGRIIFSTLIPSGSSCVFGGDGWIMELDSTDGSPLADPPFDLDNDGVFDLVDDGNGNMVSPGGTKSTGGAPSTPGILDAGDGKEYKYISGTDQGSIQVISEQGDSGGGVSEQTPQPRFLRTALPPRIVGAW